MTTKTILIDIVSDLVCPWCFLGRKRLINALAQLDGLDVTLNWKPFQLTPDMPKNGKPYQAHMKTILGSQNAVDEAERHLIVLGEEDGIAFDFEAIKTAPNSLDAHRVVYWAAQDKPGMQDKMVGELFSRYFEQGQNIGQAETLVDAANSIGMRADVIDKLLKTDIDRQTVEQDILLARHIGVRGVPSFIIDQKFVVMGAQPSNILADAIQQTADGFEPGLAEDR